MFLTHFVTLPSILSSSNNRVGGEGGGGWGGEVCLSGMVGSTGNLNINKWGVQIKRGGLKNVLG